MRDKTPDMTAVNPGGRKFWLPVILAATTLVYLRSLNYGLVNWDDALARRDMYGTGLDWAQLKSILVPRLSLTYQPVRELTTALLAKMPDSLGWAPYHLVSMVLYLGSVLLFYLVLTRLLQRAGEGLGEEGRRLAALAATAVFALHPGHVEVVAWTLGQKDVLVGFFCLAAIYFYTRSERPGWRDILLTLAAYFLALGSKPSAVSLPLVLAAFDYFFRPEAWRGKDLRRSLTVYAIFLLPAVSMALFFILSSARTGAVLVGGGLWSRLWKVDAALVFSLLKFLFPVNLVLRYPALHPAGISMLSLWLNLAAGLGSLAFVLYSAYRRKGWSFFLVWAGLAFLPNSNLVPIRIERADRYFYLSSCGLSAAAGWAFAVLYTRCRDLARVAVSAAGGVTLCILGLASFNQVGYWKDGTAAWGHVVKLYPDIPLGRVTLGNSYLLRGEDELALEAYKPLLLKIPPNTLAIRGTVQVFIRRGQTDRALEFLNLGLRYSPGDELLNEMLVRIRVSNGETDKAREAIGLWLKNNPDSKRARVLKAELDSRGGEPDAAEADLEKQLQVHPQDTDAMNDLVELWINRGEYVRADSLLDNSLARNPSLDRSRLNNAYLLSKTGREKEAREIYSRFQPARLDRRGLEFMGAWYYSQAQYGKALDCFSAIAWRWPEQATGFNNAGVVLEKLGRLEAADSMYLRAVLLDSSYVDALFNRGNVLARLGRTEKALVCYRRADSLAGGGDRIIVEALLRTNLARGDTAAARSYAARLKAGKP